MMIHVNYALQIIIDYWSHDDIIEIFKQFFGNCTELSILKYSSNVMDDMIYNDSVQLYGLKIFLQEFSDMKNKEAIEVKLWDEYLMFAYLFGMADKVAKQFKNLYPEVVAEMEARNLDYGTFVYINHLSTTSVHAASSARSAAQSYSGGGGGFNSGGGGGGFSGGGGGGSR